MYPFRTKVSFYGEELLACHPPRSWRTTLCRLSATTVSIYSQLPTILEAVPPSAAWGNMPWWQGPTCLGPYAGTDARLHAQRMWRRSCRYTTALEKTDYCRVSSPVTAVTRLLISLTVRDCLSVLYFGVHAFFEHCNSCRSSFCAHCNYRLFANEFPCPSHA